MISHYRFHSVDNRERFPKRRDEKMNGKSVLETFRPMMDHMFLSRQSGMRSDWYRCLLHLRQEVDARLDKA